MKTAIVKTQAGYFYEEGKILYSFLEGEIDEADVKDHITKGFEHISQQPILVLSNVKKLEKLTEKARLYLGGADAKKLVLKNAIVLNSVLQRMTVNFFENLGYPSYPSGVFTDEAKAIAWLLKEPNTPPKNP